MCDRPQRARAIHIALHDNLNVKFSAIHDRYRLFIYL